MRLRIGLLAVAVGLGLLTPPASAAAAPTAAPTAAAPTASAVQLPTGRAVSLRTTTPGYTGLSVRHRYWLGYTSPISANSSQVDKLDATFFVRAGLASTACYSFESRNFPGHFLRHFNYRVRIAANDHSGQFARDATFCATNGNSGIGGVSLRSYNFPNRYLRHYYGQLWIASYGGPLASDATYRWTYDTTWTVGAPWWLSNANVPTGYRSIRALTPGLTNQYVRHRFDLAYISVITTALDRFDATFRVVPGLAESSCYSFESRNFPGHYLRHYNYRVRKDANNRTWQFALDATFCAQPGNAGVGVSWQSYNLRDRYLRHYYGAVWIARNSGPLPADTPTLWAYDSSWLISAPWA